MSQYAKGKGWKANFEYFMNREYAYQPGQRQMQMLRQTLFRNSSKTLYHVDNKLPIDKINKVPNLAWFCVPCHCMVHNSRYRLKQR